MSRPRDWRNAAALKAGQWAWDNAAPPEDDDEDEAFDPEEAERDKADRHIEEQFWRGQER